MASDFLELIESQEQEVERILSERRPIIKDGNVYSGRLVLCFDDVTEEDLKALHDAGREYYFHNRDDRTKVRVLGKFYNFRSRHEGNQ